MDRDSKLDEKAQSLTDYALGNFVPSLVIERLLDPKASYFAHKEILFAGLCAWTICPHRPELIDEAMALAGIMQMARSEAAYQAKLPGDLFLADIIARVSGLGIDFYRDFYYPIGGLSRVLCLPSKDALAKALKENSKNVGFLIELMRVCHYHAVYLQENNRFRSASIIGSCQVVSTLLREENLGDHCTLNDILLSNKPSRTVDGLNCLKKAAPFQKSAALIYAASSLQVDGKNLLSIIRDGEASFAKHARLMPEWLGRSIFVAEVIIRPMYKRGSREGQTDFIPNWDSVTIPTPEYGDLSAVIEHSFSVSTPSNSKTQRSKIPHR